MKQFIKVHTIGFTGVNDYFIDINKVIAFDFIDSGSGDPFKGAMTISLSNGLNLRLNLESTQQLLELLKKDATIN